MSLPPTESPNGFEPPKAKVVRMNSKVVLVIVAILSGMVSVLLYSIFDVSKSNETQQTQQKERAAQTDNLPLTEGAPSSSGLATAKPVANLPTIGEPQESSTQKPMTPEEEARRRDLEQIRRMKAQMHLAALQAPLAVTISMENRRPDSVVTRQNISPSEGARTASSSESSSEQYDASDRRDKEAFLDTRSRRADEWTLGHQRQAGARCEIKTGTVIPGIMLTGVNSDLPGKIIGQVSQNVYDTATGRLLLIPQGSRLFGVYDSRVAVGQDRVLIAWNRIVFPDGSSITLDSMPGTDQAGYGGVEDQVNNHYFRIFGSAMIMSLISGGTAYAVDSLRPESSSNSNQNPTLRDEMGTALATQLGQASLQLLQQNVNIKPTLEIRPGFRFNIVLIKDLVFEAPYAPMR